MLEQETIDRLHEMRLPKMADAYLAQDSDEHWKQTDFDTRFAALVDAEHRSRVSNRRVRLLKLANLDQPHARLEEINYTSGRKLERRLIERLGEYRDAIRGEDAATLRKLLAEGRAAKEASK